MDQVVFNFHDVILLMTATLCILFATLLVATNPPKNVSNLFLAGFLVAHAMIPLHELVLWGAEFKLVIREHLPGIYFLGGFAYYLDTVLLYFYIKSLFFRDFHLQRKDSAHLLPLLVFAIFMLLAFYRFPAEIRHAWIRAESFVYSSGYITMDLLCKLLRMGYCIACLRLTVKYRDLLKSTHSNIEKVDLAWLKLLVVGFLVVTVMEVVLSCSKVIAIFASYDFLHQAPRNIIEVIGLSGYYVTFALVCTLVFTANRYFSGMETVRQKDKDSKKTAPEKLLNPDFAAQIDQRMRDKQTYLQPDITLDMLADSLEMPAKDLSMIINRHFNHNFYEFVNGYRIEEAKRMLLDDKFKGKTMTDIYLDVGFNSKSVFNTFFKKLVGMTPSEYRAQGARAQPVSH